MENPDCHEEKRIIVRLEPFNIKAVAYRCYEISTDVCYTIYTYMQSAYSYVSSTIDNKLREKYSIYDTDNIKCGICMDKQKETVLIPCGHTLCRHCKSLVDTCPICRQKINGSIDFYL